MLAVAGAARVLGPPPVAAISANAYEPALRGPDPLDAAAPPGASDDRNSILHAVRSVPGLTRAGDAGASRRWVCADGEMLSTKDAGGFVGATIGMYAFSGQP